MKNANDYTMDLLEKFNFDLSGIDGNQVFELILGMAQADNNQKAVKEIKAKIEMVEV
tara:strand:- start:2264 stop:2434 length:171 start_codon:yes stop_codon:yes gene_type:complete